MNPKHLGGLLYENALVLLAALAFQVMLVVAWTVRIEPLYFYLQYRSTDVWSYEHLTFMVLGAMLALAVPRRLTNVADLAIGMIYVLTIAPTMAIVPIHRETADDPRAVTYLYLIIVAFLLLTAIARTGVALDDVPLPTLSRRHVRFAVLGTLSVSYLLVLMWYRFRLSLEPFKDIYGVRAQSAELSLDVPLPVRYTLNWLVRVLNPLIVVYGIATRRPLYWVGGALGQLLLFTVSAHKSTLLSLLMILCAYWLTGPRNRVAFRYSLLRLVAVGSMALLVIGRGPLGFLIEESYRRIALSGGLFSSLYFARFADGDRVGLLALGGGGSAQAIARVAGTYYAYNPLSPNAHVFADGYARSGLIGVMAVAVVLGLVLAVIRSLTWHYDTRLVSAYMSVPIYALADSALTVVLATHGLLVSMLLIVAGRPIFARSGAPPPDALDLTDRPPPPTAAIPTSPNVPVGS